MSDTSLDDLVRVAMSAPNERRQEALRLLQGQLPTPEPYLTLRELSRRLGFAESSLRRWRIPGHDLGGTVRYRLSEVDAYLRTEDHLRRLAALRAERRLRISAKGAFPKPRYHTPTKGA